MQLNLYFLNKNPKLCTVKEKLALEYRIYFINLYSSF